MEKYGKGRIAPRIKVLLPGEVNWDMLTEIHSTSE